MPRLILLSMLMLLPNLTLAQEVGDIVYVTAREYPLIKDVDNKFPVRTLIRGSMLRIDAVEENWFKTSWDGFSLWISRKNVALPDEAIEYFTQAIEENPTAQDHDIRGWSIILSGNTIWPWRISIKRSCWTRNMRWHSADGGRSIMI